MECSSSSIGSCFAGGGSTAGIGAGSATMGIVGYLVAETAIKRLHAPTKVDGSRWKKASSRSLSA